MGIHIREMETTKDLIKQRIISGSLRVLIPLYITYIVFLLSVFFVFIPQQKKQILDQKKKSIRYLTESAVSLLADYELRVQQGKLSGETARNEAKNQIRHLRYGPNGKDYFWITDYHPFMIMHPYLPELEGKDMTEFQDNAGNYPFMAMVEIVLKNQAGHVNYFWQWNDVPGVSVPKISYVRGFSPWKWIIGTGVYENDILKEISVITHQFFLIFTGILFFIVLISLYITFQVIRIEKNKNAAQMAQALEELRLKKLLDLNLLAGESDTAITEFALEEVIELTQSQIGYLAFLDKEESLLTMHTWSEQAMKQCEIKDKKLIYNILDTGLWASAARTRAPVLINDYPAYEAPDKKGCPIGHVDIQRVLNVPIFDQDKIVALAGVGNKKDPYNDSDIRQLQLMMGGMWKIIQKSRAEKQLKDSEERYRLLAENATDGIWIIELSTLKFTYATPAMARIFGYDAHEFIDMELGQNMSPDSLKKARALISEELARDGTPGVDPDRHQSLELEIVRSDGQKAWVESTARFLRDDKGRPDRMLGITRDISQRKVLEERMRQIQKMEALGTLAGGIAHDFNNILTSIIGFTELAKQMLDKNSDVHKNLDHVLAGGLRARELVKQILIFSRKADVSKEIIPLVPLVRECLDFLRASLTPDIEIRQNIHYKDGRILADSTQMHQVLMNLFTNAAHAMKEKGGLLEIDLTSTHISQEDLPMAGEISPGPYVQILIKDSGTGIPPDLKDKIFEPFFTTKPRGEGTGMGLSLVYGIIKEMSGAISVSGKPGQGTSFNILIPDLSSRKDPTFPLSQDQVVRGRGKILLVDDEPAIIDYSSQALMKLGYEVEGFENPALALERFNQTPRGFDLVLTDLAMPGMTGLELAKEILIQRPDIPIVMITGFCEDITLEGIRELGLADLIMKPIITGELSQVVKRALTDNREKGE